MNVTKELDKLTDSELCSYWNILQMGQRTIQVGTSDRLTTSRMRIASQLLTNRNIPHVAGKLINTVRIVKPAA